MLKRIFKLSLVFALAMSLCVPLSSNADDNTRYMVEQIISGNQDYLVLANIIEKGTSAYEVQVFEEIGFSADDTANDGEVSTITDLRINVEGFKNYMYYNDYDYRPQKGDNVLLSLKFNGNAYSIKNGAFRVDSTSHEQFSFMVPESLNGSEEALELNALYIYIHSNGEIKDLSIRNGAVYGKDSNGEEQKMEILSGLKFLDEFGDTTEKPSAVELYGQGNENKPQSKWEIVLLIVVIGLAAGVLVVKFAGKLEKKYE